MSQTTNQLLIHRFLVTQTSNAPYLASPWNSLQAAVARAAAAAAEEVMESPSSVSENSMGEQGKNMEKPGETYGKIGEKRRFHLGLVCVFLSSKLRMKMQAAKNYGSTGKNVDLSSRKWMYLCGCRNSLSEERTST